MKVFHNLVALGMIAALAVAGCAPDITETDFFSRHPDPSEAPEEETPHVLGQAQVDGWELALLSLGDPYAGYNQLFVRLRAPGAEAPVNRADVQLLASREVDGTVVTTPSDPPLEAVANAEGLIPARALFLQSGADPVTWDVTVRAGIDGTIREAVFDVPVIDSLWLQVVERGPEPPYYVAWIQPERPQTGDDTIAFGLFEPAPGGFRGIEDATLDLYPYMDMGGGEGHSTPYVAPVHAGGGRYAGEINFIMSGGWDMTVYVQRPGKGQDTVVFQRFIVQ